MAVNVRRRPRRLVPEDQLPLLQVEAEVAQDLVARMSGGMRFAIPDPGVGETVRVPTLERRRRQLLAPIVLLLVARRRVRAARLEEDEVLTVETLKSVQLGQGQEREIQQRDDAGLVTLAVMHNQ